LHCFEASWYLTQDSNIPCSRKSCFFHSPHCLLYLLQQWVDLARYTGIQKSEENLPSAKGAMPPETESAHLEHGEVDVDNLDGSSNTNKQSSGPT
jgi:hypothetical protein